MNILMTGGTGLIGSALTRALLADGHTVSILTRSPERAQASLPGARLVKWDGSSAHGWEGLVEDSEVVINLAGESLASGRWSDERKARLSSSRLQAGKALAEAIAQAAQRPRLLIQSSAVGYYGTSQLAELDESSPAGNDFLAHICLEWEASTQAVEAMGVRRAIIRTGVVLSRAGGALPQMVLPFRLMAGGPLGNGKQWVSWIHLNDEVGAIRFLASHPDVSGVYNLTAPNPLTNADFGRILGRTLHRPYWLPAPAFALKLLLGEMSTLVLDGQKVLPRRLLDSGYVFTFSRLEDALNDLWINPA